MTLWTLDLASGTNTYEAVREAGDRLGEIAEDVARKIAGLVSSDPDAGATLAIVQQVSSDPQTTGIELSAEVLRWLLLAGASVSIDQFVWDDVPGHGPPQAAPGEPRQSDGNQ